MFSGRPSVRPSVCYQTCERDVLKTNHSVLMQIGASGLWGKGMKQSTLGVRKSKVRVSNFTAAQGHSRSRKFFLPRSLKNHLTKFNQI